MAKRKFRVMIIMKGQFLTALCEKCSAKFTVPLADDLQSATDEAEAEFEKHTCKASKIS